MSVLTGEVAEIYLEDGKPMGKVSIGGAYVHIVLTLLIEVKVGDRLLIDSGIAVSRIEEEEVVS